MMGLGRDGWWGATSTRCAMGFLCITRFVGGGAKGVDSRMR